MTKLQFHKEKNFFMEWLMLHEMATGEIALWHTLMNIGNRLGQKRTFNVPTSTLMKLTGLSKQGLLKARKRLMERGFIRYQKGSQSKAPVYEMIPLIETVELYAAANPFQTEALTFHVHGEPLDLPSAHGWNADAGLSRSGELTDRSTRKLTSSFTKECPQEEPIHKVKNKKEKRRGGRSKGGSHSLFAMYEQNMHPLTPLTERELARWMEEFGETVVEEALLLTVKKGGRTFSYLEAILKEWLHAGLRTIQDVRDYELKKELKKSRKLIPIHHQRKKEAPEKEQSLEEWLQEELK